MYWDLVFLRIRNISYVFAVISGINCLLTLDEIDHPTERKICKWSAIVLAVCLLSIIFIK
ncbi:MAG: hypothetical protein ACRCZH_02530 [Cetobacterium sp.]